MTASFIFAGLCLLFAIVFCIVRAKKASWCSLTLKTLASLCFVMSAVSAMVARGFNLVALFIIIGLCFGLVGDIILDLKIMYPEKSDIYFIIGTLAFFIGHLFYLANAIIYLDAISKIWLVAVALAAGVALRFIIFASSKKMNLNFGKHYHLAGSYTIILAMMLVLSILIAIFVPAYWLFAAGMFLFLTSDLVLSIQYFGGNDKKILIYVNHILYYLAQIAIALFILIG